MITGASSGIGRATALLFARSGWHVVLAARRADRLRELVAELPSAAHHLLDVADSRSVASFAALVDDVDVLVNNAGLALGLESLEEIDETNMRTMWETNVMGVVRVTQALLPRLERSGRGHIVNVGSTAGFETYAGGGGYTASKHALRAVTQTLRLELLGRPVRVTQVDPGLVETEFSLVRFGGDRERAAKPYAGMTPLTPEDVADAILWAVSRPAHVNVDQIVMRPAAQANSTTVARNA